MELGVFGRTSAEEGGAVTRAAGFALRFAGLGALLAFTAGAGDAPVKRPTAPAPDLSHMVAIAAGTFTMGDPSTKVGPYGDAWFINQRPAHQVTLGAFSIDRDEVTAAEFARFLSYAAGEYHFDPNQPIERVGGGYLPIKGREAQPVNYVTWEAARDYCLWAGKRLPTEAEWERTAAGLTAREYPWGSDGPTCQRATFFTGSAYCRSEPRSTGATGATPEGVRDLAGSVAEWVGDAYQDFYDAGATTDPRGPATGQYRVVRGGGYLDNALTLRTRARWGLDPARGASNVGFRCAYSGPPSDPDLRGPLADIADQGRVPTDRPLAKAAPEPPPIASSLVGPTSLAVLGGTLYALDRSAGTVVALANGQAKTVVKDLVGANDMASDGVALWLATDTEIDRIQPPGLVPIKFAPAKKALRIGASPDYVAWSDSDGIWLGPSLSLLPIVGVRGLAIGQGALYYATDGAGDSAKREVGKIDYPVPTPQAKTLVPAADFPTGYAPIDVAPAPDGTVWYLQRTDAWPGGGHLCKLGPSGPLTCLTHAPAFSERLALGPKGQVVLTANRVLAALASDGTTYTTLSHWTHPGGLLFSPTGTLTWTDSHAGLVLTAPP